MATIKGKIFSINISVKKGTIKSAVNIARLIENFGMEGDAHGGPGDRQISILPIEKIQEQNECPKVKNKGVNLAPGDFAENITTEGIDTSLLKIGDRLTIGEEVEIEISKIGKECHKYCEIYKQVGNCIMPKQGIFARILKGGKIRIGDMIS